MKKILLNSIIILIFSANLTFSQNILPQEMLKFSQNYSWGTARSMGMAGAYGALGADMSSLSMNPAGLGVYRSSEFSFTTSLNYNNSISDFYGLSNEDFAQKLNLGNVGIVWTYNSQRDIGWVTASFGMAYNRLNDFNRSVVMKTNSATSSLLDEFAFYANGGHYNDPSILDGPVSPNNLYSFYEGLAYDTYALDRVLLGDWYHSDYSFNHAYGEFQERQITTKGGIGEYDFSFGANYSNQFFFGATFGIQQIRYNNEVRHTEEDRNKTVQNLDLFDFYEYNDITGAGYNFKLGFIYKPADFIRFGLAVHTPTMYSLKSDFSTYMYSQFDTDIVPADGGGYTNYSYKSSDIRHEDNKLQTPWKFIGSLGLQFQNVGLISFDYERLNYANLRLSGDNLNTQNDDVKSLYQSVNNIRVGGEFKLDNVAFRGGFGLYQTPYKSSDLSYIDYTTYTAGIGYRGKSFSIDFAYMYLNYPDKYKLYDIVERERTVGNTVEVYNIKDPVVSKIDYKLNRFVVTLGFRF